MFSQKDKEQIAAKGMDLTLVNDQIDNFIKGFDFLNIDRAATVGDGIFSISEEDRGGFIGLYNRDSREQVVCKFVPASGAASRMFKDLFAFLESSENGQDLPEGNAFIQQFFASFKDFAFAKKVDSLLSAGGEGSLEENIAAKNFHKIVAYVVTAQGLNYGQMPKGLLAFHDYRSGSRTPFEEHLMEGIGYGVSKGNKVHLHFTVSPEHEERFRELLEEALPALQIASGFFFEVSFSQQEPATDTIAVDMDNQPFRNGDGSILFRPGGHGALLANLNKIKADLVFVKNIDNVVPDRLKKETIENKQLIGGVLLYFQQQYFSFLEAYEKNGNLASLNVEVHEFLKNDAGFQFAADFESLDVDKQAEILKDILNRPIRVCGMVKNEGEPGGGPFWVKGKDGNNSLQIVESAQIDFSKEDQKKLVSEATHFNPVDLVCSLKDFKGNKFDLLSFRDPETGFIAYKSKDGKELKAQELPGLWNGAMAFWNTIFVEVPVVTFNPVKTVNDLLRDEHQ